MPVNNLNINLGDLLKKLTPAKKRRFLGWRIAYFFTIGIILAGGMYTMLFVYKNIFTTLSNSYNIMVLSSELGMDNVDMNEFERARTAVDKHLEPTTIPDDLRNLFQYNIVVSATSTPTSTKKQ